MRHKAIELLLGLMFVYTLALAVWISARVLFQF